MKMPCLDDGLNTKNISQPFQVILIEILTNGGRNTRTLKIKGPDNPTSQLLTIISNKSCSGTGKEGKTKEVVEDREVNKVVCEELCVIKLCVKDVCDTIMCVTDCVQ